MTQRGESVSFDRAAGFYDATRGLSPQVVAAQTSLLREALKDVDEPTLEIGVGTGRVALPLAAAGARIVGVDLSAAMLAALRNKSPDALALVRADATRLPFRENVFGGSVVAHVLHLVSDWRAVVDELRRVVRPGGVLLVTRSAPPAGVGAEIRRRTRAAVGWTLPPGRLEDLAAVDEFITSVGGEVMALPDLTTDDAFTAEDVLRYTETNTFSWTWDMDPDALATAVVEVRDWVTRTYGDPASVPIPPTPIRWHRYRLPDPD